MTMPIYDLSGSHFLTGFNDVIIYLPPRPSPALAILLIDTPHHDGD